MVQQIELMSLGAAAPGLVDTISVMPIDAKIGLFGRALGCLREVGSCFAALLKNGTPFENTKLFAFISTPFKIKSIISTIFGIKNSNHNEKIDAAISILGNTGCVGLGVTTAAEGLSSVGAVGARSLGWCVPLGIVASVFSLFNIVSTIKVLWEGRHFGKEINAVAALNKSDEDYSIDDFKNLRELFESKHIKEKTFIAKQLGSDGEGFVAEIRKIESVANKVFASGDFVKIAECKKIMKSTARLVEWRFTEAKDVRKFSLGVDALGLIGAGLMFTPISIVGLSISAATAIYELGSIVSQDQDRRKFEMTLCNASTILENVYGTEEAILIQNLASL